MKEKLIDLISGIENECFFAFIYEIFEYYANKWGLI